MSMHRLSAVLLLSYLPLTSFTAEAQQTSAPQPPAGSNWSRVEALPPHTGLHLTTDHGGHSCRVFAVNDDTLTCEGSGRTAGRVFQRAEIRHIKLTHYVRSTLVGAGVGAGIGAISGGIAGRSHCTASGGFNFCGIGIGAGGVAAIFGVGAGVLGAAIGGPTDFARGSSIYVRP
jgi:hypothetical protein